MNIGIQKAVEIAGSQAELGRLVGVTRGQIHQWLNEWSEVPPKKCVLIEIFTGVSRKKLRADWQEIWPENVKDALYAFAMGAHVRANWVRNFKRCIK